MTENTLCHDAFCWPVSNSAVENRVSQDILSPRKSLKASSVATVSTDCHRMLITTGLIFVSGLVGASPRWLILELAIAVVNQFNCPNAERLRMYIKIYIFLRSSRQIKLPVLDALGTQITRLYLKYNALYC